MITLTFPVSFCFGKCDFVDSIIEYDLSEADVQRLSIAAAEDDGMDFNQNAGVHDIYDGVYLAVIEREKSELREYPDLVLDMLASEADENDEEFDPDQSITDEQIEKYLDNVIITVGYPKIIE